MKNALRDYGKRALEGSDFRVRCQSDFENGVPELIAEVQKKFLVPRNSKTAFEPFWEKFGIELPDDVKEYINLYWHACVYGACNCDKQKENGEGYYKFDEGLVLFPVLKHNGETDDNILFQEQGVYELTKEFREDYEEDVEDSQGELAAKVKDYICVGWTEYSAYKILYKVSTGEIYLQNSSEEKVVDDKPIANSLAELIHKLYFLI